MSIQYTVRNNLCHGCGTCAGVCPNGAITMVEEQSKGVYLPVIDTNECDNCALCFRSCPGHFVDFKDLSNTFLTGLHSHRDILLGWYQACYTGHANNDRIRYNSASGGVVTALLIYLIEQRRIDGVLVTTMDKRNPLRPKPFIARNRDEIMAASKSKYCPVAANAALREIARENGRFAVVGLPCHVQGVRKAQKTEDGLREKIVMVLGIFCGMAWNFHATETLLEKVNVSVGDVEAIDYRGSGWPGKMMMRLKDGALKELPYPYPLKEMDVDFRTFTPARCILCSDASSELADISFGDADFSVQDDEETGKSIIIPRGLAGKELLRSAKSDKVLALEKISGKDVVRLRKNLLLRKKKIVLAHLSLYKLSKAEIPVYNQELLRPGIGDYLSAVSLHLRIFLSKKKRLKKTFLLFRYIKNKIY